MCGIVGLFFKRPGMENTLGPLLSTMLDTMRDRGPDSAGFAIYGTPRANGAVKFTVRGARDADLNAFARLVSSRLGCEVDCAVHGSHAVLAILGATEQQVFDAVRHIDPTVSIVAVGRRMELFKEVGQPADVARIFGLEQMAGSHGIGHTRMATESVVTTQGAHPFTTGRDQCLVHNGSLSNHASLRRMLISKGQTFETDNDSEVAAGYLSWRLREGDSLDQALEQCLAALDGFYTFVVGTETGFAVLRDPVSCKPAVMAETDDWVAFGSEYRALVDLPGIATARVWEPAPARVYSWAQAA
jgi:glutamate synthase domain-containing protein 1